MPVEFEDVEFRDIAETGRGLGVCSDDPEQASRVARVSAAGPAPKLSQLVNTAPVRDIEPDVSSSAAEPVTAVKHMDDDDDDDDRPPGEVLPSDSPHVLQPFHSAPEHAFQWLCAAKDEASVDIMGRMFCCNFLRKSRL
jgi:hypothetical protein